MATLPRLVFSASTNWVDVTAPTVTGAAIDAEGDSITVTLSRACKLTSGSATDFALSTPGFTLSSLSVSGTSATMAISPAVESDDEPTLAYTQPGNGIESLYAGVDLATFSGQAITNNSAVGGFTAQTAVFSSGNYARRTTASTGIADGKAFTLSVWAKSTGSDGVEQTIFDICNSSAPSVPKLRLRKLADNTINIEARTASGTLLLYATNTTAITSGSGWVHIYICIDALTATTNHRLYINGVNEYTNSTLSNVNDIDLDPTNYRMTVGAGGSATVPWVGELAELWFDDSFHSDHTDFRAGSVPADIGATGSTPTGTAPALYLSRNGSGNSWATDSSGNGNTLTVTGTLGTGTPP